MVEAKKKNVAVVFGGRSAEHEISIITALEIIGALDVEKYHIVPVYIDARGKWFTGEKLVKKEFYKNLPDGLGELKQVILSPVPGAGGLTVISGEDKGLMSIFGGSKQEIIPVDVYLPAFHGQLGEDGCIQGLFELADVAYTGCGVLASAAAMNKYHCKSILHAHGVPVLPATVVSRQEVHKDVAKMRERIRGTRGLEEFPLFVKPCNLGSSVGVSRADDQAALDTALAKVFELDLEAIVEPCVTNLLEVNVSVMESPEGPEASVVEIPVASAGVLTYEDKYMRQGKGKKGSGRSVQGMAGLTRVIDPEDLGEEIKTAVVRSAIEAYRIMGCAGVVRFDFMVDLDTNQLYFNELNPLPGSMAHYLWVKSKPPVLYTEMLTRIIEGAVHRKELSSGLKRDLGFRALT
jgi:D-alanine-D-alanine ligase